MIFRSPRAASHDTDAGNAQVAVRRTPMRMAAHGNTMQRLVLLGSGASHIVSNTEAQVLAHTGRLAPVADHAQRIAGATGASSSQVRGLLDALHARGLLQTRDALLEAVGPQAPAKPERIGIITANRPDSALRCAQQLTTAGRAHDNLRPLLVTDDSTGAQARQALRTGLGRLASESDTPIALVDHRIAQALVDALAAELDPPDARQHLGALLIGSQGVGCGANRNTQQLLCAGTAFVSLDDDTLPLFIKPPGASDAPRLGGPADPLAYWLHAHRDDIWQQHAMHALAPDTVHAALLGHAPTAVCDTHTSLDGLDDRGLAALAGGRIRATMTGAAGDCGMHTPGYLLWNDTPSLDRLTADADTYQALRFGRNVVRAATQPVATRGTLFMGACTAYDGLEVLPPFPPRHRNSDGVFGAALCMADPQAWIGHLPLAVRHDPPDQRVTQVDQALTALPGLGSNSLLRLVLHQLPTATTGDGIATGLRRAGFGLRGLCETSPAGFRARLLELAHQQLAAHVRRLEHCLDTRGEHPHWWAADVQAQLDAALAAEDLRPHITSAIGAASFEHAAQAVQDDWSLYAWALTHWPAIWAAARHCNADILRAAQLR